MSEIQSAPPVNLTGPLTDLLRSILLQAPKLLVFGAILVAGCLLAVAARVAVSRMLARVGFNRAVERGGIRRALAAGRYDASDLVARLVYYTLMLITLQVSFGVFGPNPVSDLIKSVVGWLPRAAVAIVIVVVASAIASAVRTVVASALGGLDYGHALAAVAAWFVVGLGAIAALNQIGVATTVTMPVLVAVLATVGGILVVGVGGGLVRPMQQRWDRWLDRAARDAQTLAQRANAYAAGRTDLYRSGTPAAYPAPADPKAYPAPAGPSAYPAPADPTGYRLPAYAAAPTPTAPAAASGWDEEPTQQYPRPTGG